MKRLRMVAAAAAAIGTLVLSSQSVAQYRNTNSSIKDAPANVGYGYGYVGLTGGFGTAQLDPDEFGNSKDDGWLAGAYAGYWYRPRSGPFGIGVEGDYVRTGFKWTEDCGDCDPDTIKSQWNASARARAGVYLTEELVAYGTAGMAWTDISSPGPVYGGGLQLQMAPRAAIRAEVLHYDFDGTASDQTVGRLGLTFRLN